MSRLLKRIMQEALDKKIKCVEIIPGKGSGQLKKTVLRFLNRPEIKAMYHRIDKDSKLRASFCLFSILMGDNTLA